MYSRMKTARFLLALALVIATGVLPVVTGAQEIEPGNGRDCHATAMRAATGVGDVVALFAQAAAGDQGTAGLPPCDGQSCPDNCVMTSVCSASCLSATVSGPPEMAEHRPSMAKALNDPGLIGLSHIPSIRPPISSS